jgi:hypothetical protein
MPRGRRGEYEMMNKEELRERRPVIAIRSSVAFLEASLAQRLRKMSEAHKVIPRLIFALEFSGEDFFR